MYLINKKIKSNIIINFENYLVTNFLNTTIISLIKNNFNKKIIKRIIIIKKTENTFFFNFLIKKIKFGYYIKNKKFISNNLLNINKVLPNKIYLFEFLFKNNIFNSKTFITRKFNFKKKKINKILINKNYIGIIKNVINYGIFIDIGIHDGLLHISEIPNIKKKYNFFFIKNFILIKITKFDKKLKKISLNLKKNCKKNIFIFNYNFFFKCKIKKHKNYSFICYNNNNKNFILLNKNLLFKNNDIINAFYIKKYKKKYYLNINNKIVKKKEKYQILIIKHKFNNIFLMSYKKKKFLYKNILKNINFNNIIFYKFLLFYKINNDFNKIIYINNNYYFKNNNFFLKINLKLKLNKYFNIFFILNKKKIFFLIKNF
ncbi:MAG: S1 RNA-binding domain-containing protein [Candidatus Carsonella ruddii]